MAGWKNIYFNYKKKEIFLKEQGETEFKKFPYQYGYYVKDPSGQSKIKSIHGIPVIKRYANSKYEIKELKAAGIWMAESDIDEMASFLNSYYYDKELNISDGIMRTCFMDIEISSGEKYRPKHIIKVKNIQTNEESEIPLYEIELNLNANLYKIFDEEKNTWLEYSNSCYAPVNEFPEPTKAKYPINLITCYNSVESTTFTFGLKAYTGKKKFNYVYDEDEFTLLKKFVKWFYKAKFDTITGWNVDTFDLTYIVNRLKLLEATFGETRKYEELLSPLSIIKQENIFEDRNDAKRITGHHYLFAGINLLDYMQVYKTFSIKDQPSYSLNYICQDEINDGKTELDGQMNIIYKSNWNLFVEYNIQDVMLVVKLDKKLKYLDLIYQYAYDCRSIFEKTFGKVATSEGYILNYMRHHDLVMPDRQPTKTDWWKEEKMYIVKDKLGNIHYQNCTDESPTSFPDFFVKAGYCLAKPGLYKTLINGDIRSSYPHQIMMYNISPETKVIKPSQAEIDSGTLIQSDINGVWFKRSEHAILPDIVKEVFNERMYFKNLKNEAKTPELKEFYDRRQLQKKLIINSIYGVCLNAGFHLFDIDCARCITRAARQCIKFLISTSENYYVSKAFLLDAKKYLPNINIKVNDKYYSFLENEKLNIKRNNIEMQIEAKDILSSDLIDIPQEMIDYNEML